MKKTWYWAKHVWLWGLLIVLLTACTFGQTEEPVEMEAVPESTAETTALPGEDDVSPVAEGQDSVPDPLQVEVDLRQQPQIPLATLSIGSRIRDVGWTWAHRAGENHTNEGGTMALRPEQVKPVVWIIVGRDHYEVEGADSHIVLLSEEFLFKYRYSTGKNHWRDSEVRAFLNDVFYGSMGEAFRQKALLTAIPNWDLANGNYISQDYAWILSNDELGGGHVASQPTGTVLAYFEIGAEGGPSDEDELRQRRMATLQGEPNLVMRYPSRSMYYANDESISMPENFSGEMGSYGKIYSPSQAYRVAISLNPEGIQVTEVPDVEGVHTIVWVE